MRYQSLERESKGNVMRYQSLEQKTEEMQSKINPHKMLTDTCPLIKY